MSARRFASIKEIEESPNCTLLQHGGSFFLIWNDQLLMLANFRIEIREIKVDIVF